jgi:hypothetical protein
LLGVNQTAPGASSTSNHGFHMAVGQVHGPWCKPPLSPAHLLPIPKEERTKERKKHTLHHVCGCYVFGCFCSLATYIYLVCGKLRIEGQTPYTHIFKQDQTTSSTFINCFDWEDFCIQLRNQQTCISNNHK